MIFGFNALTFVFITIAAFTGELLYDVACAIWDRYHDDDDYNDTASV